MSRIQPLPPELIKKIAAGEVVERPASVVKELVENSIDAEADTVNIRVVGAGLDEISVEDNGIGIPREELRLAVMHHTTSKINTLEDLYRLRTYGFRGEALASISGVSRLFIHSRHRSSKMGYELDVYADLVRPKARDIGTTVKVRDLFFNVPARRKFLKSPATERRYIKDTVLNFIFLDRSLSLRLELEGRTIWEFTRSEDLVHRFSKVVGVPLDHIVEGNAKNENVQTKVWVVRSDKVVDTVYKVFKIFVNERPIYDSALKQLILDVFREVLPYDLSPVGIFKFYLPSQWVDFNVHPRKIHVRFSNWLRVQELIREQLQEILRKNLKRPQSSVSFVLPKPSLQLEALKLRDIVASGPENKELSLHPEERKETDLKVFQVWDTFLIAEIGDELWIVDQHAAAERIEYERLIAEFWDDYPVQKYLRPIRTKISQDTVEEELLDFLKDLGFNVRIEKGELAFLGGPVGVEKTALEALVQGLGDASILPKGRLKELVTYRFATKACKASVKAGDSLSVYEANLLLKELLKCKEPFFCPHGRPVVWRLSRREVEKHFFR